MSPSTETHESRAGAWEIKFLVTPALAEQIRGWACAHLLPDPNPQWAHGDSYRTTSLYFDTEQLDVFHRGGSYGRGKYRVRRYGQSELGFLERKLRTHSRLTKRRSVVELGDLERLAWAEPQRDWTGCWFHRRLLARKLGPLCQVSYDRTARVAALSFVRFRTVVRDTQDTAYVIFAVVISMAVGAKNLWVAGLGLGVCGLAAYLMMLRAKLLPAVPAAVVLSMRVGLGHDLESLLGATLDAHLQERELMSVGTGKQGIALDVTYQARLRPSGSAHGLVMSLNRIDGVQSASVQRRSFEEV